MDAVLYDGVLLNGLNTCLYFCMKQFNYKLITALIMFHSTI